MDVNQPDEEIQSVRRDEGLYDFSYGKHDIHKGSYFRFVWGGADEQP